jgi:polysaccharide export outer membrane protein
VTTASVKAGQHTSAGRGSRSAAAFKSVTTPGNEEYKIGPLDVLEISVFKVPELSKSVQVADTGTVNLPLVGAMPAAGKTAEQLERELESKLGAKYLQSPQVTVYVKEFNSQRATVEGAVKKPGVYPIKGKTSLLQFIAMAEGLHESSDTTAVVFRQVNGQRSAGRFDISAIRAGRANDPAIQQGDVVVVGESAIKATFNNIVKALPAIGAFAPLL